jgi:hypothetical protein
MIFLKNLCIGLVFNFVIVYFCYRIVKLKIVLEKKTNYNPSGIHNTVHKFGVLAWGA